MTKNILNFIDAVESGKSIAIESAFAELIADRINNAIDERKVEIAQSLFKESVKEKVEEPLAEAELNEVDVHVSGKPSKADVDHLESGAKLHGGKFDGHSDKGAYYKFPNKGAAQKFKAHADKSPSKKLFGDVLDESITEEEFNALDESEQALYELSKSTLGSYVKKASKYAAGAATNAMHFQNVSNALSNQNLKKKSDEFRKHSSDATDKQFKRLSGIDKAADRLVK